MRPNIKAIFHWKYANWVIGLAGAAMLTAALASKFSLAYIFLAVTLVYSAGCWFTSDTFARNFSTSTKLYLPSEAAVIVKRHAWKWLLLPLSFAVLLCGVAGLWIHDLEIAEELRSFKGRLFPASDQTPPNACGELAKDATILILGDNATFTHKFPHTVLMVGDRPVIALVRDEGGGMSVEMEVRSPDNRIVVQMNKDGFIVNQNNQLDMKRQDKSSLEVIDQQGNRLKARYANSKTFVLNGSISIPGRGVLALQFPNVHQSCAGDSGRADFAIR